MSKKIILKAARRFSSTEYLPIHPVGAGLLTRPPVSGQASFHAEGFVLWASFFPSDGKETKGSPGETHIAVGNKFPPAPVRSPRTPVYGGYPYALP